MLISPREEKHITPLKSAKASNRICRQSFISMANMRLPIRVRNCSGNIKRLTSALIYTHDFSIQSINQLFYFKFFKICSDYLSTKPLARKQDIIQIIHCARSKSLKEKKLCNINVFLSRFKASTSNARVCRVSHKPSH